MLNWNWFANDTKGNAVVSGQNTPITQDSLSTYQSARKSRDPRFDGVFFLGVVSTGIYCRPICPAPSPKEENVRYFHTAIEAANQGFRPCLRCRPDSAPGSHAWQGNTTTFNRAINLIQQGALQENSLEQLSSKLGITSRYLRKLFDQHLGCSPKHFAQYQQILFAKKLLHETDMPISDIAFGAGFNSVRRFNDCFQKQLSLSPSQVRGKRKHTRESISLRLYYRPPYHWPQVRHFYSEQLIAGMEWIGEHIYGRTFTDSDFQGWFTATHKPEKHAFDIDITISASRYLQPVVKQIRRMLDLDVDPLQIRTQLALAGLPPHEITEGLRIPGVWSPFEAGTRAVFRQHVDSNPAAKHINEFIQLTMHTPENNGKASNGKFRFPLPAHVSLTDIASLSAPLPIKRELIALVTYFSSQEAQPDNEDSIEGVTAYTNEYIKLRATGDPDIFLDNDKVIKEKMDFLRLKMQPELASPFGSYLSYQLWYMSI